MTAGGRIGSLTGKDEGGNLTLAHANYSHVHAVSAAGNDVFTYDANGNMASRLFHESYKFDVENRLTQSASYPSQTEYTYNGGGDLVRRTSSSSQYPGAVDEKNVYVDGIYEQQCFGGGAPIVTKRYEAFGRVFAERRSTPVPGPSTLTYLLSDHLNSTVGTTTTAGEAVDRMQYYPFGSVRSGGVATDRTYTGQQTEAGSALKLSYYHARFYSAELGSFVSADSIAVDGLNRYSYALNSPIHCSDPDGHCVLEQFCSKDQIKTALRCAFRADCPDKSADGITKGMMMTFSWWAIQQQSFFDWAQLFLGPRGDGSYANRGFARDISDIRMDVPTWSPRHWMPLKWSGVRVSTGELGESASAPVEIGGNPSEDTVGWINGYSFSYSYIDYQVAPSYELDDNSLRVEVLTSEDGRQPFTSQGTGMLPISYSLFDPIHNGREGAWLRVRFSVMTVQADGALIAPADRSPQTSTITLWYR
jgi:RHS repeat-associated protein